MILAQLLLPSFPLAPLHRTTPARRAGPLGIHPQAPSHLPCSPLPREGPFCLFLCCLSIEYGSRLFVTFPRSSLSPLCCGPLPSSPDIYSSLLVPFLFFVLFRMRILFGSFSLVFSLPRCLPVSPFAPLPCFGILALPSPPFLSSPSRSIVLFAGPVLSPSSPPCYSRSSSFSCLPALFIFTNLFSCRSSPLPFLFSLPSVYYFRASIFSVSFYSSPAGNAFLLFFPTSFAFLVLLSFALPPLHQACLPPYPHPMPFLLLSTEPPPHRLIPYLFSAFPMSFTPPPCVSVRFPSSSTFQTPLLLLWTHRPNLSSSSEVPTLLSL